MSQSRGCKGFQHLSKRFYNLSSFRGRSTSGPNIAIAGATGAVGEELLNLIESRNFRFNNLKLLASSKSAGKEINFLNKNYIIEELTKSSFEDVDLAFFSCGGNNSLEYGPYAVESGCIVIDNSSAFRMHPNIPLIVPEINGLDQIDELLLNLTDEEDGSDHSYGAVIANPNCSTIMLTIAINPIFEQYGIDRVVVSTYQAASGAGMTAMKDLELQAKNWAQNGQLTKEEVDNSYFGRQYIWNLFSHNSKIDLESGYNEEELKMINETKKIFGDSEIKVTATSVRVPVLRAHSESINLTLKEDFNSVEEIRDLLEHSSGLKVLDNIEKNEFPEPLHATNKDDCYVGRIRRDLSQDKGLEMFISCDQIRKGAALNAVQIAELVLDQMLMKQKRMMK